MSPVPATSRITPLRSPTRSGSLLARPGPRAGAPDLLRGCARGVALLATLLAGGPSDADAAPDFTSSTGAFSPQPPVAGEVLRYDVRVVNTGETSGYSRVRSDLPHGYLIEAQGDCRGSYDREQRALVWHEGPFAAGEAKECIVRLLTRREDAGAVAALDTSIDSLTAGYWRFSTAPELASAPPVEAARFGRYVVTPAGLVVLGFLALFLAGAPVLLLARRGPSGPGARLQLGAWATIVFSLGLFTLFGWLAYQDWRAWTVFRETTCTVFDHEIERLESATVDVGSGRRTAVHRAHFALRYDVDGIETFSAGYATPTSLSTGSIGPAARAVEHFAIGTTHPCWYDPDDVTNVLLDRRPGGAYVFLVAPVLGLLLATWILRRPPSRRREPDAARP